MSLVSSLVISSQNLELDYFIVHHKLYGEGQRYIGLQNEDW